MTITPVQGRSVQGAGGTSVSLAFLTSNVVAGNTIIAAVGSYQDNPLLFTCADNNSNTYTRDRAVKGTFTGATIFSAPNIAATPNAKPTITVTGISAIDKTLMIAEFSGLLTSGIADTGNTGTGTSSPYSPGTTATLAQADELVCIVASHDGVGVSTPTASGYTIDAALLQTGTVNMPAFLGYKVVAATTAQTASIAWENSMNTGYAAAIATYKASAAAAPDAPTVGAETNVSVYSFGANWAAAGTGGAPTGYRLDVATDSGFTAFVSGYNNLDVGLVTTYPVTGLAANTTYYYRVRAYNGTGTSASSGTESLTTLAAQPPFRLGRDYLGATTIRLLGGTLLTQTFTLSGSATISAPTGSGAGLTYLSNSVLSGTGTVPAPTGSGAGLTHTPPTYTLSGNGSVPAPTGSGTGLTFTKPTYTLSGGGSVPAPTGSGAGLTSTPPVYTLSGGGTAPAPTGSGAGLTYRSNSALSGSGTVPAPTGSGAGLTSTPPTYTLSGNGTVPGPAGSGAGLQTGPPTYTLSGNGSVPAPTGSGTGLTFVQPTYTLNGSGTVPAPTGSGTGLTFTKPTYTLSGGGTVPAPAGSGVGLVFANAIYTLSGNGSVPAPTGSGAGLTSTKPTYTLSGSASVPAPTGSGAGLTYRSNSLLTGNASVPAPTGSGIGLTNTPPTYTLSGSASTPAPTGGGTGLTFVQPTSELSGTGTVPAPAGSGVGLTFVQPTYTLDGSGEVPAPSGTGTLAFVQPMYTLDGEAIVEAPIGSGTGLISIDPSQAHSIVGVHADVTWDSVPWSIVTLDDKATATLTLEPVTRALVT